MRYYVLLLVAVMVRVEVYLLLLVAVMVSVEVYVLLLVAVMWGWRFMYCS